jgi:glucose/mannose-6-phosphate isomerase
MEDTIKNFAKQFSYQPEIINKEKLAVHDKFILVGMGGSHLPAGLLKTFDPQLDLYIHRDYGLPKLPEYFLKESLVILSSYSGNTEEVLEAGAQALKENLAIAVMTSGGALLKFAQDNSLPHIIFPDATIQPRAAIGYSTIALATLFGRTDMLAALKEVTLPANLEELAKPIATDLVNKVPVIYTSRENQAIAYNWKIKLNETGKVPAFYNVFSELNHNELEGFDVSASFAPILGNFHIIFLTDESDHPQIRKRMRVMQELLTLRNISNASFSLQSESQTELSIYERVFRALLIADFVAIALAKQYGSDPERVALIEDFKSKIKAEAGQ